MPITKAESSPDGMLLAYALGSKFYEIICLQDDWAKGIWGVS